MLGVGRWVLCICADGLIGRWGTVANLIIFMGESGSGRRAIVKAIVANIGIVAEGAIGDIIYGRSEKKLQVLRSLRDALSNIGLEDAAAPISIIIPAEDSGAFILLHDEAWTDFEFKLH